MVLAILFIVLFLIIPYAILMAARAIKNSIKTMLFGRRKSKTAIRDEQLREGFNDKTFKRIRFTMKDPRNTPIPFRLVFLIIYIIGAVVAAVAGFNESGKLFFTSILIAYGAIVFAFVSANGIVTERDKVLARMVELKGSKMKLINKGKGKIATPESEFRILEWHEDLINPVKMHLYMPTDFDILSVDSFLESFNLIFGINGQWISDSNDKEYGGFDFSAGVAAIRVSGKLPAIAMWHERYLNHEDIHWSYFPLALGSENGVPVYNEELGKTEHVLGFAVNSGQEKLSKKNGVHIGSEITAAPQILIAGGTGGGKALSSDTKVRILKREEDDRVDLED